MHQHAYDQNMINFTYKFVWGNFDQVLIMSWSWNLTFSIKSIRKNEMMSRLFFIRMKNVEMKKIFFEIKMKWNLISNHLNEMKKTLDSIIFLLKNSRPIPQRIHKKEFITFVMHEFRFDVVESDCISCFLTHLKSSFIEKVLQFRVCHELFVDFFRNSC